MTASEPPYHPFDVAPDYLAENIEAMVDMTFADLTSEFLILPKGSGFIDYAAFCDAYEVLKSYTHGFGSFSIAEVTKAVLENSRAFCVIRAMLGVSAPEWAELALTELGVDIGQSEARNLDRCCRLDSKFLAAVSERFGQKVVREGDQARRPNALIALNALLAIAIKHLNAGAPAVGEEQIHRFAKFDTAQGLESVQYAAHEGVPYAMLLYERYLGRPFATHRDAVSEQVGEVMENAIEERLRQKGITYRKTKRAERIPGFGQAPDFCIPDEVSPAVIIEAKITSDDGTARDKVTRILRLVTQRDNHVKSGDKKPYEVIACIDGRGFRQRREDMRQMLLELHGKVFTLASLDELFESTRLREFVTK
jgi:hypothetical protein